MGTLDRIKRYKQQRQRALDGKYNCLPLPFVRFKRYLPGTEKGKYIIVTANQKIGKSKFVDYVYVYSTILFIMEHPEIRAKIFYSHHSSLQTRIVSGDELLMGCFYICLIHNSILHRCIYL